MGIKLINISASGREKNHLENMQHPGGDLQKIRFTKYGLTIRFV
jgi:hypothetical protein